jgi:hypothetical protein
MNYLSFFRPQATNETPAWQRPESKSRVIDAEEEGI